MKPIGLGVCLRVLRLCCSAGSYSQLGTSLCKVTRRNGQTVVRRRQRRDCGGCADDMDLEHRYRHWVNVDGKLAIFYAQIHDVVEKPQAVRQHFCGFEVDGAAEVECSI